MLPVRYGYYAGPVTTNYTDQLFAVLSIYCILTVINKVCFALIYTHSYSTQRG